MRKLALLAGLALVPVPAASADGCPAPCSGQSSSPPNAKFLYVQPDGPRGPVTAYATATGRTAFSLPPGVSSADGRWHLTSSPARSRTTLLRFALRNGSLASSWSVPGRWDVAALAPSGRWAALSSSESSGPVTRIAILDGARGVLAERVTLRGRFEVETISADGRRLFLIEHLDDTRYLVRLFDLTRNRLKTQALKASGEGAPMVGLAWSGVASPDGQWLLTLYLNTHHNHAFVHALDLERSAPACVDLPSGNGDLSALKRYTLTLSPDGKTLFAANPALGVVASIDLQTLRVTKTARFTPSGAGSSSRQLLSGTISRNGRTLYFSAGNGLWAYDAAYSRVRGPYPTERRIVGFGYGAGDRTIHALRVDGRMLTFDAATGRRVR